MPTPAAGTDAIETSSELVVAFGGMAIKNADVHGGCNSVHSVRDRTPRPFPCRRHRAGSRFFRRPSTPSATTIAVAIPDGIHGRGTPKPVPIRSISSATSRTNARGSCLAAAVLSDDLRQGVMQLATGAWFEPHDPAAADAMCVHGNPNVLTRDVGTSRLAQGSTGQLTRVEVERFEGTPPPVRIFEPMSFAELTDAPGARRGNL